jgi:hypothetical protein
VESPKDSQPPAQPDDEDELEPREYSSPPCYLHEFEQPPSEPDAAGKTPKPAAGASTAPKSKDTK